MEIGSGGGGGSRGEENDSGFSLKLKVKRKIPPPRHLLSFDDCPALKRGMRKRSIPPSLTASAVNPLRSKTPAYEETGVFINKLSLRLSV